MVSVFVVCWGAPTAALAQSAQENSPDRVIDVEAARRAKQREHGFHAYQIPLAPFLLLGRGMEKGLLAVDRHHLLEKARYYLAEHEHGVLPAFGGLGMASGMTLGARYYQRDFLRPGGRLDIPVRISTRLYQEYGVTTSLPLESGKRVFFDTEAFYRVRRRDSFFGFGNYTRKQDRTNYQLQTREILFGPRFALARGLDLAAQFGFRNTHVLEGADERFPATQQRFRVTAAPGLASGAREWLGGAKLVYDTRDIPGRPRAGGYHHFAATWHQSADQNDFGFWRYELLAHRYIPLGGTHRTLSLRLLGITNQRRGGSAVPFFEQATLGGLYTLRGFRDFRFYDLSALLLTAEYRFDLNSFMDVAFFADEGQVGRQPGDFGWSRFRSGHGIAFSMFSRQGTPFRLIFGRSNEGMRIQFYFGATF